MASPILNVTEFWIASTGEILDQSGTSQFHAQNNYANLILVNLEDGGGYDSTTFINFTPQTKTAYTSHWFYMSYQGLTEHEVNGEIRSFAQYAIRVPRVVLQNSNKNGFTINDVIVKQTYGDNFIGQFDTLASLNSEYPPTEALDDANSVAYVIADADRGFYQVELDGTYGWALMESVALTLETKQYNGVQIQVQAGSANPADVVSVSEETVKILMGILNNLQVDVDRIDANIDEVENDAILLEARVSTNEEDIDSLEGRADSLETFQNVTVPATYETISNVDLVKDRVEDLETFQEVTVPATYETKADATTHKARTTALENANMVKSIAVVGTNLFTITFYDNTTSNILTLAQLKTFIGNATNALSGLMTAQHVTDLEMLMALFDGDGDAVVNTIAEVLAIFENYPEGVDLVSALAGKVNTSDIVNDLTTGGIDKVLSAEQGKTLQTNKVEEALNDGKTYARRNKSWVEVTSGGSGGYEPDNITIGLNEENKLEVKNNLEIDGGFL